VTYEFMKKRVVLSKDGMPDKRVWLLVRRTIGKDPTYAFFIAITV